MALAWASLALGVRPVAARADDAAPGRRRASPAACRPACVNDESSGVVIELPSRPWALNTRPEWGSWFRPPPPRRVSRSAAAARRSVPQGARRPAVRPAHLETRAAERRLAEQSAIVLAQAEALLIPAPGDAGPAPQTAGVPTDEDEQTLGFRPLPGVGARMPQPTAALELEEVLSAVEASFPLLLAVMQERMSTDGEILSAIGNYDLGITANGLQYPEGFYDYYRTLIGLDQLTAWNGTRFFSYYKWGVGNVPAWYGNRQTDDGGELGVGFQLPLLKNGAIDKPRAELYKARVARRLAEPAIQKARIDYSNDAARAYWDWVQAGRNERITRALLDIALVRDRQIARRIELGDIAPIERVDNNRVIAQRQAKLIGYQRKWQQATIKLSLFYRDELGQPLLADTDRLPEFPEPVEPDWDELRNQGIEQAFSIRPELAQLRFQIEKYRIEYDLWQNQRQPGLDVMVTAAQDVGGPAPKKDKSEFQLEAGLLFDVPLQRREARGKVRTASAQLMKLHAQLRYAEDRIRTEVQDSVSALAAAYRQLGRSRVFADAAQQMQDAERKRFDLGDSTILIINLREQATFDARQLYIDDLGEYFRAAADYNAAVGLPLAPDPPPDLSQPPPGSWTGEFDP